METKKLTLKSLKNVLTKQEMRNIMAGSGSCLAIGEPCYENVQCCSNSCVRGLSPILGEFCAVS